MPFTRAGSEHAGCLSAINFYLGCLSQRNFGENLLSKQIQNAIQPPSASQQGAGVGGVGRVDTHSPSSTDDFLIQGHPKLAAFPLQSCDLPSIPEFTIFFSIWRFNLISYCGVNYGNSSPRFLDIFLSPPGWETALIQQGCLCGDSAC